MSLATTIRDGVIAKINDAMTAGTLTPKITAVGIYEITFGLKDLTGGRVSVMPANDVPTLLNRAGVMQHEITVDVAVQYKSNTAPGSAAQLAELDPFLTLAESIQSMFPAKSLTAGQVCTEAKYPHGLWLPEHMKDYSVLTSVVRLTFIKNQ